MSWTVADSRHLYNLQQWGEGYFDIAEDGQMLVRPDARADSPAIGLADVAAELGEHSLGLPCLLRFPQILGYRVEKLRGAFTAAMQDTQYQGGYTPVYPIKVNQQRRVWKKFCGRAQAMWALKRAASRNCWLCWALCQQAAPSSAMAIRIASTFVWR